MYAHDIYLGHVDHQSNKIFSEQRTANPAIWKRSEEVVINAPEHEIISAIQINDLREGKDGEAEVSGGIGTPSVTITLKSPTVFRGYDFQIDVYSTNPTGRYQGKGSEYSNMYGNYQEDQHYGTKN